MSINKNYAVFGLGRYGYAVAKELIHSGADVLAVDINPHIVNSVCGEIPLCKCADITDPDVLNQLGIGNFDTVIISMAENLEASVMAIALCKEAGVPTIIAKCSSDLHGKILSKVGADKVVFPENESGTRLAKNLLSSDFVDVMELSEDFVMIELNVKKEWVGKNLIELNLRKKYDLNIVAVKEDSALSVSIDPEAPLKSNSSLIVIANNAKLKKLL